MKKRAPTKRLPAKKSVTTRTAAKRAVVQASPPADRRETGQRAQAEIEKAKYTPAPLKTDGWPAFRYPPP